MMKASFRSWLIPVFMVIAPLMPSADEPVEIVLIDSLDEPRGFCLDILGYQEQANPLGGAQVHTCYSDQGKLGIDQAFDGDHIETGEFQFAAFDGQWNPAITLNACDGSDASRGEPLFAVCAVCHGALGQGRQQRDAPKLDGREDWYLIRQMKNFTLGIRGTHDEDIPGSRWRSPRVCWWIKRPTTTSPHTSQPCQMVLRQQRSTMTLDHTDGTRISQLSNPATPSQVSVITPYVWDAMGSKPRACAC